MVVPASMLACGTSLLQIKKEDVHRTRQQSTSKQMRAFLENCISKLVIEVGMS
jgi:hypothetical protein